MEAGGESPNVLHITNFVTGGLRASSTATNNVDHVVSTAGGVTISATGIPVEKMSGGVTVSTKTSCKQCRACLLTIPAGKVSQDVGWVFVPVKMATPLTDVEFIAVREK